MSRIYRTEALIFDLDGTLFDTEPFALPAFARTFQRLGEKGVYKGEAPSAQEITNTFGMVMPDLWRTLIPGITPEHIPIANDLLAQEEVALLRLGEGDLYEGVAATLHVMNDQGLRLFVASNGAEPYVKGVIHYKGLDAVMEKVYSAGEYQTDTKEELVSILLHAAGIKRAVMVGDRRSDVTAGLSNGLPVIGCQFSAFGSDDELREATVLIRSFHELPDALRTIEEAL